MTLSLCLKSDLDRYQIFWFDSVKTNKKKIFGMIFFFIPLQEKTQYLTYFQYFTKSFFFFFHSQQHQTVLTRSWDQKKNPLTFTTVSFKADGSSSATPAAQLASLQFP